MVALDFTVSALLLPFKRCQMCRLAFPATAEYFHRDKSRHDGLQPRCKTCQNHLTRIHKQQNREYYRHKSRTYYAAHKPYLSAYNRKYRQRHLEEITQRQHKNYRATKPHRQEWQRRYYAENPEKIRARNRLYLATYPEKNREFHQRRRARKAQAPLNDLTRHQWEEIKDAYGDRCVYCGKKSQRMTQDHITPLSKGGSHTVSNIVPACRSCNSRKNAGAVLIPVQPLLITIAAKRGA